MPRKLHDPVGERYNNMTIIKSLGIHGPKSVRWVLARCDCGNKKEVRYANLKHYGSPRDCGCGIGSKNRHGLTNDPLHNLWLQMKNRCYNSNHKSYKDYGAQGVTVAPEWVDDFKQFYDWANENGYQPGLQLDRIDPDGNYSPRKLPLGYSGRKSQNTADFYEDYCVW